MLVTKDHIDYQVAPYGKIAHIPAGVPVIPATMRPTNDKFWVCLWPGMNEQATSWMDNYGFMVEAKDVTDCPFTIGQRVRIRPSKHFPPVKSNRGYRYGIIQGMTRHPGMCLVNEDGRPSNQGEWAFIVASYHSPNAGALWHSAAGLEPMKKVAQKRK